jgi:hypothetical protein
VAGSPFKTRNAAQHLTATLVLLAVFALPFHFHAFTPTAQLAQECSCYQGARTYAVALTQPADWTPLVHISAVHQEQPELITRIAFRFTAIRAPPSLALV